MKSSKPTDDAFTAIADPTRRAILVRLAVEGERNVTQLGESFAMSQPAVSKHLRVLRNAGLVQNRKAGRESLYGIDTGRLRDVHDWVSQFEKYWDDKLDALGEYLDKRQKSRTKKG